VHHYGRDELLHRLADPFWFQAFGAVMGMDWHSSGITTSVIGALKRGLAPVRTELGLFVCGGKGAHSRRTPAELIEMGERTGVDANALVRASRLVAKIDSAAVQDGYDLYLHGFFATVDGKWCVVQQGMNEQQREARRYHWQSDKSASFFDSPTRRSRDATSDPSSIWRTRRPAPIAAPSSRCCARARIGRSRCCASFAAARTGRSICSIKARAAPRPPPAGLDVRRGASRSAAPSRYSCRGYRPEAPARHIGRRG